MNMQTGPAPKQSMDQWLLWTGVLEIANIAIFGFLWSILSRRIAGEIRIFSILGLITLSVILLEGGAYWLLVRARFFQRAPAKLRLHLLQGLYGFNILLLLAFPALLIVRALAVLPIERADLLLGGAYYVFALGEFVHYFVFKINMRPYEWKRAIQTGRFVPARLLRELKRAEASKCERMLTELQFIIVPMTTEHARQIVEWKYDGPYAFYDYDKEADHILDSAKWGLSLFAVTDAQGALCGELTVWFQNAADERVPQAEIDTGRLAGCELWIGFGMRPDLTGQGLGLGFVTACAEFAVAFTRDRWGYTGDAIHLGVYQFNQRAIKTYERAGFVTYYQGTRVKNGVEYKTQRMKKPVTPPEAA